ncbi:MAG: beta-propeller fold lactonase family protein [Planctomycetes bacterium]|nr:beta-propeller fold lactonase family protein [Planctomycetota bacterium]
MRHARYLASLLLLVAPTLAGAQPAARDRLLLVVNREPQVLSIFRANGPFLVPIKTLPLGKGSREICLSPDGTRAYVSSQDESSLTVVDLDKLAIATTIRHPSIANADGGIVSADGKKLYVTSTSKNAVVVIDPVANTVIKDIPTGREAPRRVIISPDGKKMYVGHNKSDELAVIDLATDKVVKYIKVGNECRGGLAFTKGGKLLLNGSVEDDTVYFIDTATDRVVKIIGVPFSPQRIEVTPQGTVVVLSGGAGQSLLIMDNPESQDRNGVAVGRTPFTIVRVGNAAWGLALNEDGTVAYSSNYRDSSISVIDVVGGKLVTTVTVGPDPNGVAFRK